MPAASASIMRTDYERVADARDETALQMNEQQRDRRWSDAGNALRLTDRLRPMQIELLLNFDREAAHPAIVEIRTAAPAPPASALRAISSCWRSM